MTADIGNFAMSFALLAAMASVLAAIAGAKLDSKGAMNAARWLIGAMAALLTVASVALVVALVNSDFRNHYVAAYTERALPIGYKLAAFWAGQAGSLLTWALLLSWFSAIFVMIRSKDTGREAAATIVTLALINAFFVALMLFADRPATDTISETHANPFRVTEVVPADGHGLNPLLQDPAMIAHPPMLFLGYAGFTIPFAMLIGALIARRRDNDWLAGTRRWLVTAWMFLTVGILLGAQWAYIELGWGGYWAWDPVENASLLPWLTGTALLHSIMAQQHRGLFKKWNASLIALSFILCIFGTYLTRSGVIQSVHGFGESLIGTFFLVFLLIVTPLTALLIALRHRELKSDQEMEGLIGREGAFLATNVLLVGMMIVTVIGTMFPVISRVFGDKAKEVSVGPAFFNKVVAPMGMALIALMAVGPMLTYGEGAAKRLFKGLIVPAIVVAIAVGVALKLGIGTVWAIAAVAIVAGGITSVLTDLVRSVVNHAKEGQNPLAALVRIIDGNHRRYGGQLVHIGMLLVLAGMVGSSVFGEKKDLQFTPGQTIALGGQTLRFEQLREVRFANYTAIEAEITFTAADGKVTTMRPQRRFYDKSEQPNTEVALSSNLKRDVYLTLSGWEQDGKVTAIQAIINPLVSWIWIGGIVMTLGAIVCLLPRLLPLKVSAAVSKPVQVSIPRGRVKLKASA